jgi:hypothetical protein
MELKPIACPAMQFETIQPHNSAGWTLRFRHVMTVGNNHHHDVKRDRCDFELRLAAFEIVQPSSR